MISPFDIPIILDDGHSMNGETLKMLILIPKGFVPNDIGIMLPFSHIKLGNQLTKLSSSTYIHEIAHTQQESNSGYAESYLNKEVISVFLEKLSALESDPSGKLLCISEKTRFMYIARLMEQLVLSENGSILSDDEKLEYSMYIQSTLLAEKLFDMYLQERKQKNKDKYIYDIQGVFDGNQTIEDIINRRNITVNQGKDLSLIKRHI